MIPSRSGWLLGLALAGCGEPPREGIEPTAALAVEPDQVTVDHILIAAKNDMGKATDRSRVEAERIARDLLAQLQAGTADWAALKQKHSDDGNPGQPRGGPYTLLNHGVPGADQRTKVRRDGMVKGFGDLSFRLKVGELGLAEMGADSPYGFHIIKRLE
jgi:parvulin-like peptidyl-prolyl isomerase